MDQRLSVVTLGVSDLKRARAFYEGLGWRSRAANDDDVVFFQIGGSVLSLWDRERLAEDSGVEPASGWSGVTLAHNVASPAEVDEIAEQARTAGGTISREGRDVLGRLLERVRRSRRASVGGRAQSALDDWRGRQRHARGLAGTTRAARRQRWCRLPVCRGASEEGVRWHACPPARLHAFSVISYALRARLVVRFDFRSR
jgi:catechol 2,3-dioxygenase-like lactoylglutathione lyase family enzyme